MAKREKRRYKAKDQSGDEIDQILGAPTNASGGGCLSSEDLEPIGQTGEATGGPFLRASRELFTLLPSVPGLSATRIEVRQSLFIKREAIVVKRWTLAQSR